VPDPTLPDWFDKDAEEQVLAKAEELFTKYPKHALAFTLAKLLQQRLVHPELLQVNLDMSNDIPLQLFIDAMKERTHDRTETDLKS